MTAEPADLDLAALVEPLRPDVRGVGEAVLTCLRDEAKVPARRLGVDVRICEDLHVCEEDLNDVVVDVAARLKRVLPSRAELEGAPPVVTVRDVIISIAGMKHA
jgi:hypothetical protein